jgi:N-methylhydantoinase B
MNRRANSRGGPDGLKKRAAASRSASRVEQPRSSAGFARATEGGKARRGAKPHVDKITVEVIREALSSIVREMRVTLVRTAYSSILYEGEDFSCVLMDGDANLVAMSRGQDHPLHIVPIAWSMKAVRERFGDAIRPGDIFLHNDPYTGGTHLNDVAMIYPMFAGGELLLFPVVRAHWGDVGGMSPGSLSGQATEIYQEGVRIPPIKVVDRGRPDAAALELIFGNMRGPSDREGDFRAMIGTCKKAAERVQGLVDRYGARTLKAVIRELLDRAEARMRARIRALPRGEYVYEAYLEGGRERFEPLRVRARVVIEGDAITVDLAGTSPQTAGPTNVGPAMAPTGAFTIVKAFLDPGADVNSGAFRPLTVITPAGTIVNARRPAPCGGMVEVKYAVESAVMGALGQAIAGKVTGDIKGGGNHCYIGGPDPRSGDTFIFYEYPAGGTGAFEGGDGSNTVRAFTESDMTTLQPVEAVEQKYPVRIERTAMRADSGGNGQWRGGLGLVREVRLLADQAQLSVLAERSLLPPYGVAGGMSGAPNRFHVRRDGRDVEPSAVPGKVSAFGLVRDDVVVMASSGGGGYGDPLARDPGLVAADLREGVVSRDTAERVYGVVLREVSAASGDAQRGTGVIAGDGVRLEIDVAATEARRRERRLARPRLTVVLDDTLDEDQVRRVVLDDATAHRIGVGEGDVVELVNPHGAPVRLWVARGEPGDGARARVSAETLAMLGARAGAGLEIRAVYVQPRG